jgi:hypothetical protein
MGKPTAASHSRMLFGGCAPVNPVGKTELIKNSCMLPRKRKLIGNNGIQLTVSKTPFFGVY